jgi:diguanylate cyclase (GGDEF)-like protein
MVTAEEMKTLVELSRSRSVPWAVATREASAEEEVEVLSLGAVEYLPMTEKTIVAQARLERIMRDRYLLNRDQQNQKNDLLTGLPNRSALLDKLQVEWERAKNSDLSLSLVSIDLNGFKAYNNAHGYLSGDQCLKQIAKTLKHSACRPGDYLIRFSGDEFAILLPSMAPEETQVLADRIRGLVKEAKIENRATEEGMLSVKVGCHTIMPGTGSTTYELVDLAFQKLK